MCYAQSVKLPTSRNRQAYCPVREMGTVSAHFTKWANVVNEIYILVHAVAMHGGAVRQGRRLYIFKVFIEYPVNLGSHGCISLQKLHRYQGRRHGVYCPTFARGCS